MKPSKLTIAPSMVQVHLRVRNHETKTQTWSDAMLLLDVWRRSSASRAIALVQLGAEELTEIAAGMLRGVTSKGIK